MGVEIVLGHSVVPYAVFPALIGALGTAAVYHARAWRRNRKEAYRRKSAAGGLSIVCAIGALIAVVAGWHAVTAPDSVPVEDATELALEDHYGVEVTGFRIPFDGDDVPVHVIDGDRLANAVVFRDDERVGLFTEDRDGNLTQWPVPGE